MPSNARILTTLLDDRHDGTNTPNLQFQRDTDRGPKRSTTTAGIQAGPDRKLLTINHNCLSQEELSRSRMLIVPFLHFYLTRECCPVWTRSNLTHNSHFMSNELGDTPVVECGDVG